ncbi:MAG: hypothetical protein JO211_06610 [Acidobacteriaceae bacterium]|nr:hypothetical protein [Acidobacteriaceae bacterium]
MKLRFRQNSLRLRVNRREVEGLAAGAILKEQIHFPGNVRFVYMLESSPDRTPGASFENGVIRVRAPEQQLRRWAASEEIGIYFELSGNGTSLRIAIEKDLECVDGPSEEQDPHAYPRVLSKNC